MWQAGDVVLFFSTQLPDFFFSIIKHEGNLLCDGMLNLVCCSYQEDQRLGGYPPSINSSCEEN